MIKTILKYLKLFHDSGIVDGQVVLDKTWGYPYKTRDIPDGPAPKVIVHSGLFFGDTGKYDSEGFRIYEQDLGIYKHTSLGE